VKGEREEHEARSRKHGARSMEREAGWTLNRLRFTFFLHSPAHPLTCPLTHPLFGTGDRGRGTIPQSLNPSIPQSLNPSIPQSLNPSKALELKNRSLDKRKFGGSLKIQTPAEKKVCDTMREGLRFPELYLSMFRRDMTTLGGLSRGAPSMDNCQIHSICCFGPFVLSPAGQ